MMRITRARVIVQTFFLALFVFLAIVTAYGRMRGYPVSLLLELDPLVAISSALSAHTLYRSLLWALLIVGLSLLLGRFFCGWICPFGTLHHVIGWLARPRAREARIELNRARRFHAIKYPLLAALGVAAVLGALQTGLLDPIALLSRSVTTVVWPAVDAGQGWLFARPPVFHLAWLTGGLLVALLVVNVVSPRFFCRTLCPLGALLGVTARFSWWRIHRDVSKCTDCDLCLQRCEGAADPQTFLRKAECYVCMNCLDDCEHGALSFRFLPPRSGEIAHVSAGRRSLLLGSVVGLVFQPLSRLGGATGRLFEKMVIRPPGSLAEREFLARCIKCDQCIRVCPTNVLQPALFQAGIEGIWTPLLDNRAGYCELNCVLCGQVCPTGAIRRIGLDEKLGVGTYEGRPIRLGTAFFDRGRCLPWSMQTPCVVCEEVCPTSPKAIYTTPAQSTTQDGRVVTLRLPYVDPQRCIGCGICEHECPVADAAGVRVTAIGETRDSDHALLLS